MPHFKVRPSREPSDDCPDRSSRGVVRKPKSLDTSSSEKLSSEELTLDSGRSKKKKNESERHVPRKCIVIRRTPAGKNREKTELRIVSYDAPREKGQGGSPTYSTLMDAASLLAERLKELETSRVTKQHDGGQKVKESQTGNVKKEEDPLSWTMEKAVEKNVRHLAPAPLQPFDSSAGEKSDEELCIHKNNKECKKETKTDVTTTSTVSDTNEVKRKTAALPEHCPLRRFSEESSFVSCSEQCCKKNLCERPPGEELSGVAEKLKRVYERIQRIHEARPSEESRVILSKIYTLFINFSDKHKKGEALTQRDRRNIDDVAKLAASFRKNCGTITTTTVTVTEIVDGTD